MGSAAAPALMTTFPAVALGPSAVNVVVELPMSIAWFVVLSWVVKVLPDPPMLMLPAPSKEKLVPVRPPPVLPVSVIDPPPPPAACRSIVPGPLVIVTVPSKDVRKPARMNGATEEPMRSWPFWVTCPTTGVTPRKSTFNASKTSLSKPEITTCPSSLKLYVLHCKRLQPLALVRVPTLSFL